MINLPINLPIAILALTAVVALALFLHERSRRKKLELGGQKVLEEYKQKGWENLNQSIKKSQDIIGEAELLGIKASADIKYEASKLEQEYSQRLSEIIKQSEISIANAQNQLIQFMKDIEIRSQQFEEVSRENIVQKINELFDRFENRLSDFVLSTEEKTTSSIELELKGARNLIEAYKQQQLKLIDENIIAMMEQTLNIVLAKKLSLKDQIDLVYEALEKAKIEKFVA